MIQIEIRQLKGQDRDRLNLFFQTIVKAEISKVFHPHTFDEERAQYISNYLGDDWYAGAFIRNEGAEEMVGYVMLRGWDEGFSIPSLGLCVIPQHQGLGIGDLILRIAILVAKLRQSPAIRLKVYPDNQSAIELYKRVGFTFLERMEAGQLIGFMEL